MTRINISKTNPAFIEAVKASKAAKKERFEKYFAEISTSPSTAKLKQMKLAQ